MRGWVKSGESCGGGHKESVHGRVDSVIMSLCCVGLGCGPGRDLSVNDERESGSRRMDMVHTHGEVCVVSNGLYAWASYGLLYTSITVY